jgi:drug/metabolite transporter (DMT)-like permease
MDKIQSKLKWFGASLGSIIPAISFFTSTAPPSFPQVGLVTSAVGAAIIYAVSRSGSPNRSHDFAMVRKAMRLLALAILLMVAYVALFSICTVSDPQKHKRFQVGFGTARWTLNDPAGIDCMNRYSNDKQSCMLSEGAFAEGGPEKIWQPWSIVAAAALLIVLYFCAFAAWTWAFSLLAKHESEVRPQAASRLR